MDEETYKWMKENAERINRDIEIGEGGLPYAKKDKKPITTYEAFKGLNKATHDLFMLYVKLFKIDIMTKKLNDLLLKIKKKFDERG